MNDGAATHNRSSNVLYIMYKMRCKFPVLILNPNCTFITRNKYLQSGLDNKNDATATHKH